MSVLSENRKPAFQKMFYDVFRMREPFKGQGEGYCRLHPDDKKNLPKPSRSERKVPNWLHRAARSA